MRRRARSLQPPRLHVVWTIDATLQTVRRRGLLPDGYGFSDEFGLGRSHDRAASAVSQVTATLRLGFGGEIGDTLAVSLDDGDLADAERGSLEAVFEAPPTSSRDRASSLGHGSKLMPCRRQRRQSRQRGRESTSLPMSRPPPKRRRGS